METSNRRRFLQWTGLFMAGAGVGTVIGAGARPKLDDFVRGISPEPKVTSMGLLKPGFLQWGAESLVSAAPYVYADPTQPGGLIGFEVEIAVAIAKVMGIEQKLVQTTYNDLDVKLDEKKFDLIMNGWEITDERAKKQLFSEPYYRYGQQILVRADDEGFSGINETSEFTLKHLDGMTVGTGKDFKAEEILKGHPKITTKIYDGILPFDDLAMKRLDAMMVDYPISAYYVLGNGPGGTINNAANNGSLKLAGKQIYIDDYVIALNNSVPKSLTLLAEINQAIRILKRNGTLKAIYEKWMLWDNRQSEIWIS